MPGVDVGQFVIIHIEHGIDCRHKHSLARIGDQQVVDAFHRLSGRAALDNGGTYQGPCERHEEGGGNALVGDIRNEETESLIGQVKYIVEIAAHLPGRLPACGEFPISEIAAAIRG